MWPAEEILERVAIFHLLIYTQEDQLRSVYPGVKVFDDLFLRLFKRICWYQGLDIVVRRVVNFRGGLDQGRQVLEGHEPRCRMGECTSKEALVITQE